MKKWSWRIARIAGTDIYIHASFVLAVGYFFLQANWSTPGMLGLSLFSVGAALVLVFGSVLLHELGHSLVAQHFGIPVRSIFLWPLGGFAVMEHQPDKPLHELLIAGAGPMVNVALAAVGWFLGMAMSTASIAMAFASAFTQPQSTVDPVAGSAIMSAIGMLPWVLMGVNLVLAVFNLLPAYPLDGGRIVRAGLTMLAGETRANQVTAGLGWVWGALIIALGVFLGDFIMVFVGVVVLFTSSLLPQSLQAPINLGLAFVFDRGAYHIQRGDYAQGIAHYTRVLERNPHQIKALQNRGHALMLQQCPDAALADFERMVALAPDNSHAYLNRGWAYSELRDYQRAYADFEQALQLQPNFSLAMVNRGLMHMRMGDMARAEADFRQGIALNPQEGLAYNNLACLLLVQGDPAQALEYCNQAFQYASQGMPHLYDTRAQAYHMLGQHVLAIADINQAIELRPDYAGHYFVRGSAYAALGEHSRALAECDETVRCGLDVALVEQDLHACVGFNPAWAHAYYSRMLELRPDDALAYRGRGDVHRLMGEMPKAIADYDQALLLDPDLAEAYLGRGHAYSQCFALMQAVSDFEQVGAHTTLPGPRHEAATMLHTLGVV